MLRRHPPPLDARVEADRAITGALLAAASGQPEVLAADFAAAWFHVARLAAEVDAVLVFDELVVGPPCPLLLEAAHELREVRRAEHLGRFDDEEGRTYDEHADDDAVREPPTLVDRVIASMPGGHESVRLLRGGFVARVVSLVLDRHHERWASIVALSLAMERLLVELADGIRIGDGVVVDARLLGERAAGWRWAA